MESKDNKPADKRAPISVKSFSMALYDLHRAHTAISHLQSKPLWSNTDTSSFDCMHYNGNSALIHCASILSLTPNQQILDIGSGFNSTARFLAKEYDVKVTGIEYQKDIHELAEVIKGRNEDRSVRENASSVWGNFLVVGRRELGLNGEELGMEDKDLRGEEGGFDIVVSFLCVLHIQEEDRGRLFQQAAKFLKKGGKLYIEDYYMVRKEGEKEKLMETERNLKEVVDCPFLPTNEEYFKEVEDAGLKEVKFEDVSEIWRPLLRERADGYRRVEEREEELQVFYDTVAELFEGGIVRGVRLSAVKC